MGGVLSHTVLPLGEMGAVDSIVSWLLAGLVLARIVKPTRA